MKMMANVAKGLMLAAFIAVGTTTVNAQEETTETFAPVQVGDWVKGEAVTGNGQEVYIYNVGAGTFITDSKSATETDISKALVWTIDGKNTYTFKSGDHSLYMDYSIGWITDISSIFTTSFTLTDKTTSNNSTSYKLSNSAKVWGKTQTRYFNVYGKKYTAAESKSTYNDWLFISTEQKKSYVDYVNSFNEVDSYLTNEKVEKEESLLAKIKEVLTTVSNAGHSFSTYAGEDGDKAKLTGILEEIKNFLNTPTGIENIKPATGNAQATAIYDVNGVRQNNLTKGINIVKMSDGTTKKIIK